MTKISRRNLALGIAAGSLAQLACTDDSPKSRQPGELEYNLDHLREVDASMIGYREIEAIPVNAKTLRTITVGAQGHLFVAADDAVLSLAPDRRWTRLDLGDPAVALAEITDNQLLVAFEDHLEVWHLKKGRLATWQGFGEGSLITSVAVTEDGVLAADAGLKLIHRLCLGGRAMGRFAGRDSALGVAGLVVPSPYCDLAVAPDGFVWVVNPGRHTVENYAPDGQLRTSWGRAGMDIEGFCGCCNPTHLAVLADGSFVTAEKGLPRVKVYDVTGKLKTVVAPPAAFSENVVGLDLAVDGSGRILVLDPSRRTVRRFVEIT